MLGRLIKRFRDLWIRYQGNPQKLEKAIGKAERLHRQTGRRYRVYFLSGRYRVLTRTQVQQFKHIGFWSPKVNMTRLESMQFYDTNILSNLK